MILNVDAFLRGMEKRAEAKRKAEAEERERRYSESMTGDPEAVQECGAV